MEAWHTAQTKWVMEQLEDDDDELFAVLHPLMGTPNRPGGSREGRKANIDRERAAGHDRLFRDFFAEVPIFNEVHFRRRFRMRKALFLRIQGAIVARDDYFQQKPDAIGLQGLSSIQKMTAAIRMLAYDQATDEFDEYVRIGESTGVECMKRFCEAIVNIYGGEYLRAPTPEDVERILQHNVMRGFPGMLGSIDCMHWNWKNCPRSQFHGKASYPTIILEALASYDLWIWHAFFGMPGSNNDVNILERSPLFKDLIEGVAPQADFQINGKPYSMCYLLADKSYPTLATFMQTISDPLDEKQQYFSMMQESVHKDVERSFGALQSRWGIVKNPARLWSRDTLRTIMTACIILHNMIVEDERSEYAVGHEDCEGLPDLIQKGRGERDTRFAPMICNSNAMQDEREFHELRNDLIDHLWSEKGDT